MGSAQPREYNWGAVWKKSSGSGIENREYGRGDSSRWPHGTLYPQTLELTSPTSGGHSVGIVRSRTQVRSYYYYYYCYYYYYHHHHHHYEEGICLTGRKKTARQHKIWCYLHWLSRSSGKKELFTFFSLHTEYLVRQEALRKHRVQQFYCWVFMGYCEYVFT
jgi:hypothetical protein